MARGARLLKAFVAHAITATTHQGWLLKASRVSLTCAKVLVDMAQLAIMDLRQSVADGLNLQLRGRVEDERGTELLTATFLFASTATVVSGSIAVPSALASASSVMAVARLWLGAAKDAVPENDVNLRDVPVPRAVHYADHLPSSARASLDDDRTRWERCPCVRTGRDARCVSEQLPWAPSVRAADAVHGGKPGGSRRLGS